MMFCGNCGAKIPEGVKFCPKCGANVAQFSATNDSSDSNNTQHSPVNNQRPPVQNLNTNVSNQQQNFNQNNSGNFATKIKKHRIQIIFAVLVLIVALFAFTKTTTYRNAATSDADKLSLFKKWANVSDSGPYSSNLNHMTYDEMKTAGGDCTWTLNDKTITCKTVQGSDFNAYLMDSDLYGDNITERLIKDATYASSQALQQWGKGYSLNLEDCQGKTWLVVQDGNIQTNKLDRN